MTSLVQEQNKQEAQLDLLRKQMADLLRDSEQSASKTSLSAGSSVKANHRVSLSSDQQLEKRTSNHSFLPAGASNSTQYEKFWPLEPVNLKVTGLTDLHVERLIGKYLEAIGAQTGASIAKNIALPFRLIEPILANLKEKRLLAYKSTATIGDYVYELTEKGRETAQTWSADCSYYGPAPVTLAEYIASVTAQSIRRIRVTFRDIKKAFDDIALSPAMLDQLGPAVCSGKGLFLFGAPGNGKTTIAERITKAYGQSIWIPRMLDAFGDIIQLYDPAIHHELPLCEGGGIFKDQKIDPRWVRIQRPTVIVGGELTLDSLEIKVDRQSGISEAPIQLKSNCGTLVIDDFGRQRVEPRDLLNRWIVPLEKQYDFLQTKSGRKIQVPFEQFVVFSTNMQPRDLVDDAFLRRIPYKIDVADPSEAQFRELFLAACAKSTVTCSVDELDYVIERCYRNTGREMRFCHTRDLVNQIKIYCEYKEHPPRVVRTAVDAVADNYFSSF